MVLLVKEGTLNQAFRAEAGHKGGDPKEGIIM